MLHIDFTVSRFTEGRSLTGKGTMAIGSVVAEQTERQLVAQARAGNTYAFDALVADHAPRVYRLALRILGDAEEAEEALQETLIRAYRSLGGFRGEAAFGTWLYAIAARACLTRRQAVRRRPEQVPYDELRITTEDAAEQMLRREAGDRVQRVLNQLPPQDRLLMVLRFVEELSHEEIARVMGWSVENSRTRLLRAKRAFRDHYQEETTDGEL
jgi:RNA polymerase sigma-70 factor (ECF subfamily)